MLRNSFRLWLPSQNISQLHGKLSFTIRSSFFFDLHYLLVFAPLGFYYCYSKPTNARLFIAIFGVCSVYFSCVMVRLLLLSSPALCLLSGCGVSDLIHFFVKQIKYYKGGEAVTEQAAPDTKVKANQPKYAIKEKKVKYRISFEIGILFFVVLGMMITSYLLHCTWVGAEAYASPSIILANKDRYGNKYIIDDFRESYFWMRMNTKSDAKIVSWWDYGYQIAGMSNRAVIVDNNTWNTTHIATVGAVI